MDGGVTLTMSVVLLIIPDSSRLVRDRRAGPPFTFPFGRFAHGVSCEPKKYKGETSYMKYLCKGLPVHAKHCYNPNKNIYVLFYTQ